MNVDLAVQITGDADDAARAFDKVGDSALGMADSVESAAAKADGAAGRLDGIASSADNVDSKASAATGSLGALSSGFELIGAEKAAGALQSAALATDFLSGAGQGLTLIMESQAVATTTAKVASIAKGAADRALGAASKVAAAGQWALNAAMSANPIGLVVVAIAALAAGFVIAYNRSETFRNIVNKAMDVVKTAVGGVVDRVGDIAGKVKEAADKFPSIGSAVDSVKTGVANGLQAMFAPIQWAIDKIQALYDKIKSLPGGGLIDKVLGRQARNPSASVMPSSTSSGTTELFTPYGNTPQVMMRGGVVADSRPTTVQIIIQGARDELATAREVIKALRREGIASGGTV